MTKGGGLKWLRLRVRVSEFFVDSFDVNFACMIFCK